MKIVCLLGSPRPHGNSAAMAGRFCDSALRLGGRVRTFRLNELRYRGCQGCMACKTRLERCALQDDLTQVLEAVREADLLVAASPVYFGGVSSQMKAFIDRTFSFFVPDYWTNPRRSRLEAGKKLVFMLSQQNPNEKMFADIFSRYEIYFAFMGFDRRLCIRACGVSEPGAVSSRNDVMALADEAAEEMCAGGGLNDRKVR